MSAVRTVALSLITLLVLEAISLTLGDYIAKTVAWVVAIVCLVALYREGGTE
jgi:hypothetical protein